MEHSASVRSHHARTLALVIMKHVTGNDEAERVMYPTPFDAIRRHPVPPNSIPIAKLLPAPALRRRCVHPLYTHCTLTVHVGAAAAAGSPGSPTGPGQAQFDLSRTRPDRQTPQQSDCSSFPPFTLPSLVFPFLIFLFPLCAPCQLISCLRRPAKYCSYSPRQDLHLYTVVRSAAPPAHSCFIFILLRQLS